MYVFYYCQCLFKQSQFSVAMLPASSVDQTGSTMTSYVEQLENGTEPEAPTSCESRPSSVDSTNGVVFSGSTLCNRLKQTVSSKAKPAARLASSRVVSKQYTSNPLAYFEASSNPEQYKLTNYGKRNTANWRQHIVGTDNVPHMFVENVDRYL